jgi:hypothetical protein
MDFFSYSQSQGIAYAIEPFGLCNKRGHRITVLRTGGHTRKPGAGDGRRGGGLGRFRLLSCLHSDLRMQNFAGAKNKSKISFALAHLTLVYRGHACESAILPKRKEKYTHRGRKRPIHSSSSSEHVLQNVQRHVLDDYILHCLLWVLSFNDNTYINCRGLATDPCKYLRSHFTINVCKFWKIVQKSPDHARGLPLLASLANFAPPGFRAYSSDQKLDFLTRELASQFRLFVSRQGSLK